MAWDFKLRGNSELFLVTTVDVAPNDTHHFARDGRREWYDEDAGLVKRDNVMLITRGSVIIEIENHQPVTSAFSDYPWDEETGKLGNTNPFPYVRDVYPFSKSLTMAAGDEGAEWVCCMPHDNRKVDYDCFKGNHQYRFQENDRMGDRPGYVIVLKGHACMAGIGDCEPHQVYEFPPRSDIVFEGDEDSIVLYVWERV